MKVIFQILLLHSVVHICGRAQNFAIWPNQPELLYLTNPALSFEQSSAQMVVSHQQRFRNLESSPSESSVTLLLPAENSRTLYALHLFSNRLGPLALNGLNLSYAYHILTSDNTSQRISLGMNLELNQSKFRSDQLIANDANDLLLTNIASGLFPPSVTAGVAYSSGRVAQNSPVQLSTGLSVRRTMSIENRLITLRPNNTSTWNGDLRLKFFLSRGRHLVSDLLVSTAGGEKTQIAWRVQLMDYRMGWIQLQYATQGLLHTQVGFNFNEEKGDHHWLRVNLGSTWQLGLVNQYLGNSVNLGICISPKWFRRNV